MKKFSHIPGTSPKGVKGFFLGDIPTIMDQNQKGVSIHQHLENLYAFASFIKMIAIHILKFFRVSVYGKTFK